MFSGSPNQPTSGNAGFALPLAIEGHCPACLSRHVMPHAAMTVWFHIEPSSGRASELLRSVEFEHLAKSRGASK